MRRCNALGPLALAAVLMGMASTADAQQAAPALVLEPASPPRAVTQFPYDFGLRAQGGTPLLRWKVSGGSLPPGIELDAEHGRLHGIPATPGEFSFTLTVADSGSPPQSASRSFALKVVPPLVLVWGNKPAVDGDRIQGSVEVSNNAPQDLDLTVIVVAVNEIGKAFALGYQYGPMPAETSRQSVSFGAQMNLPRGRYTVHVDAVAELPARKAIFRERLQAGAFHIP